MTLCGCENENPNNADSPELSTNQSSKAKIDNLSMDELSKDKLFEEISNIFKLDETFETAKKAVTKKGPSGKDDFEIDFSSVNKMESKVGTSYTFMIKNDEENPKHFENFVVEKHNDGSISGFIVYYEYSQRYMDNLKKGIAIPFDGTSRRTENKENLEELINLFRGAKTAKTSITAKSTAQICYETRYVTQSLCPGDAHHSDGQGPCDYGINKIWYGYLLKIVMNCTNDGSMSSNWGWVAGSQTYTSGVPDPNMTSGGSYSSTATVQPNLFDDPSTFQRFTNYYGLTGAEIEWARYRPNRIAIENFMEENYVPGIPYDAKIVPEKVISQIVANPNLKIDLYSSLNSPMNIDKLSIDKATPEGEKFNAVYDELEKSPEFKKLFVDLFNTNSRFNVKFQIGNITGGASGETNTDLLNPILNTITIDRNFLLNNSKIVIAKTIIHECIHAFLNVKLYEPSIGMSIPSINNIELYNCIDQYYNGFNSPNINQHDFIYNFMLPTLTTVLSQVKDVLISTAERQSLESLFFHPVSPTVDVAFSWHDFYKNIALGGLQDCSFFKNEIATITKDPQTGQYVSTNIIDQVKLNYYNQYKSYADIYLSKK